MSQYVVFLFVLWYGFSNSSGTSITARETERERVCGKDCQSINFDTPVLAWLAGPEENVNTILEHGGKSK